MGLRRWLKKRKLADIDRLLAEDRLNDRKAKRKLLDLAAEKDPLKAAAIAYGRTVPESQASPLESLAMQVVTKQLTQRPESAISQVKELAEIMGIVKSMTPGAAGADDGEPLSERAQIALGALEIAADTVKPYVGPWLADKLEERRGYRGRQVEIEEETPRQLPGPSAGERPRRGLMDRLRQTGADVKTNFQVRTVLANLRALTASEFAEWVNDVRNGAIGDEGAQAAGQLVQILVNTPDDELLGVLEGLANDPRNEAWEPVFAWLLRPENEMKARAMVRRLRELVPPAPAPRHEVEVLDPTGTDDEELEGW